MEQRPDLDPMDLDLLAAATWSADEVAVISKAWAEFASSYAARLVYTEQVLRAAIGRASASGQ